MDKIDKFDLTDDDKKLIEAAVTAAKEPVLQIYGERKPPRVAAALRLDNGDIITSQNMIADVGSISLCAEPQAIAEANRRVGRQIKTVVAVYHQKDREPKIIPPCGRCREIITDFSVDGYVIMRDPGTENVYKVRAVDLLPFKYADFWKENKQLI